MTLQDKVIELIDNPDAEITSEWIEEIGKAYPYFTLPAALMLQRNKAAMTLEEESALMARIALNAGDSVSLMSLHVDQDAEKWIDFYPDEEKAPSPSTDETIDTFLMTYGKPDPKEEELLTRLIFNPTPDYAQLLSEEEERSVPDLSEIPADSQDAKINAFIIKSKEKQGHFPLATEEPHKQEKPSNDNSTVTSPDTTDSSLLSESLAKIYIKQRRYSKAYEIISGLSLNFPEKSIYFADQLRFLRKLMIIEQYNSNNNNT